MQLRRELVGTVCVKISKCINAFQSFHCDPLSNSITSILSTYLQQFTVEDCGLGCVFGLKADIESSFHHLNERRHGIVRPFHENQEENFRCFHRAIERDRGKRETQFDFEREVKSSRARGWAREREGAVVP